MSIKDVAATLSTSSKSKSASVSEGLKTALRAFSDEKCRLTYSGFAQVGYHTGDFAGPSFGPWCFRALSALPEGLDALVVKSNGNCPDKHQEAPCNKEAWPILSVDDKNAVAILEQVGLKSVRA